MANETTLTVVGNTVAPAELKFTPSGAAVASFTVASTPRTLDRASGEWRDGEALFLRCSAWRDMAENVAESLSEKGMRVIVQGRLRQRSYEKDGVKRVAYELEVDEVGPSLRWAGAKVTRKGGDQARSGGGFGSSGSAPDRNPVKTQNWDEEAPF